MVNPGGTGNPIRHISARFAPLPPSSGFIEPLPSVLRPKRYTYLPAARGAGRDARAATREARGAGRERRAAVAGIFAAFFLAITIASLLSDVPMCEVRCPISRAVAQAFTPSSPRRFPKCLRA